MRCVLLCLTLLSLSAAAQDACSTQCNQQASECMKACAGDSKEASKPGNAEHLMQCLKSCDAKAVPCRAECKKPAR